MSEELKEGWGKVFRARKWHYFKNKRSLCGPWLLLSDSKNLEKGNDDSTLNCKTCQKKLAKLKEED